MNTERRQFLKKVGLNSLFVCSGISLVKGSEGINNVDIGSNIDMDKANNGVFNVFSFGAKGDGKTIDTDSIQAAIDHCHNSGGGKVYLQRGIFIITHINLKSFVTFEIEAGAVLRSAGISGHRRMIIAEDQRDLTICGRGTIDGNSDYVFSKTGPYKGEPTSDDRPGLISLKSCNNVIVRDLTLYNSASWVSTYTACRNLLIDGITIDSRENKDIEKTRYADSPGRNSDGIDLVDSEKVRISNCFIYCGDDGIVLKSHSPELACRDITICNCVISTNASGIKTGTESAGAFEDITIQNCVVYDTRNEAIALLTADGARLERINISNITARNIKGAAIGIRLGSRNRLYLDNARLNTPVLKDIIIENIQGTRISTDYGCNITGLVDYPVENVILKNINLEFDGGGTVEDSYREIAENEKSYPSGRVFGRIPAYGFFLRHIRNITLDNIWLRFSSEDNRPAILCDDVESIDINGLKAAGTVKTPEIIRFVNTREAIIHNCSLSNKVPLFLSVSGIESVRINLVNNRLSNTGKNFSIANGLTNNVVNESGTIN